MTGSGHKKGFLDLGNILVYWSGCQLYSCINFVKLICINFHTFMYVVLQPKVFLRGFPVVKS